jgi:hypothetical protein
VFAGGGVVYPKQLIVHFHVFKASTCNLNVSKLSDEKNYMI